MCIVIITIIIARYLSGTALDFAIDRKHDEVILLLRRAADKYFLLHPHEKLVKTNNKHSSNQQSFITAPKYVIYTLLVYILLFIAFIFILLLIFCTILIIYIII